MDSYERAACELMRALRGKRSQRALARRLRYRGNPVTDWENGRHFPTAADALRCAETFRFPVGDAFVRFHTLGAPHKQDGKWLLAPWLDQLRGSMSQVELARRCERSRFAVRRWLTGAAEPKLPDFLRLLDAITGRAHDWVAGLVPIEQVPSLEVLYRQAAVAKRLALEHPWTEAVLRLLETPVSSLGPGVEAAIARTLGLKVEQIVQLLDLLLDAGVVRRNATGYAVVGTLSVDTRGNPEVFARLQAHWTRVAGARLEQPRDSQRLGGSQQPGNLQQPGASQHPHKASLDWNAYNHISVSRADLTLVQERLKQTFADIRAIVAASEPVEEAAVVLLHLVHWAPAGPNDGSP